MVILPCSDREGAQNILGWRFWSGGLTFRLHEDVDGFNRCHVKRLKEGGPCASMTLGGEWLARFSRVDGYTMKEGGTTARGVDCAGSIISVMRADFFFLSARHFGV